jgi:hypothetical protein
MKALALFSTLQSADIVLPTTDRREIRLRRITEPTAEPKALLQQLGLIAPERFRINCQRTRRSAELILDKAGASLRAFWGSIDAGSREVLLETLQLAAARDIDRAETGHSAERPCSSSPLSNCCCSHIQPYCLARGAAGRGEKTVEGRFWDLFCSGWENCENR